MRHAILIGIILFALGAYQKMVLLPEVGSILLPSEVPQSNREFYMTHSAQLRPYIRREINKVDYVIAYDDETREVKYISTDDKDFKTSKGLKVGDYIELKGDEIAAFPGWEIRGPELEDGWQTMIGFDSELTILQHGREATLKLKPGQYNLPATEIRKVKIRAFVKGHN